MRRGTRVGQAYIALTADGSGINEDIVKSVDEAGPGIEKAGDEQGKKYGEHFSGGFLNRIRERLKQRGEDGAMGFNRASGAKAGESFGAGMIERLQQKLAGADRLVERLTAALDKDNGKSPSRFLELASELRKAQAEAGRLEGAIRSVARAEGVLGAAVSRNSRSGGKKTGLTSLDDWLSGTSSRNNFVNAIAKSMGAAIHGTELLISGLIKIPKLFSSVGDEAGAAGEQMSMFQKMGTGLASGATSALSSLASSGPGAIAAFVAISIGASLLVSVLSALLAIVVALAATIATALVGALAIASAGLLALVSAGGLMVLAFRSMTDAQSALFKNNVFKPIHEEAIGLGQTMLTTMIPAFKDWARNLQVAIALAQPLASVMGAAFGQVGRNLTSALTGPGVQRFLAVLKETLPGIVANLSEAFGHFLNGTLAIFAVLLPYVLQFSHYLEEVADRFTAWANSASGQNAIASFIDKAVVSLRSLWSFLGAVGGLLATVLFSTSGTRAGNNIFDSMTNAVKRFTTYLSQDNRLKKWFAEGVTFASALGQTIVVIGETLASLNNSGVISGIASMVDIGAGIYKWFHSLPGILQDMIWPLKGITDLIGAIGNVIGAGGPKGGVIGSQSQIDAFNTTMLGPLATAGNKPKSTFSGSSLSTNIDAIIASLTGSGNTALNATSVSNGGYLQKPKKPKYHNPYVAYANSLIKNGPSVAAQIRNAVLTTNKQMDTALRSASKASGADAVQSTIDSMAESAKTSAEQTVNTAQSAVNSAAQSLASASTKKATRRALAAVRQSQRDLRAAIRDQKKINAEASIIAAQKVVTESNVTALLSGLGSANATLADYAEARARIVTMLQDANAKLTAAIQLRDQYKTQVSDALKSFASMMTAQAQTIDGVQQALTSGDITSNLQDRLDKIKAFQNDLRLLLAQGLSNDAYKQIVDAGVEQGTTFANALLAGGNGAIQNTNSLVDQINNIADTLGTDTSNRLYQAGVDAAQGLVDGLTSLSAQLDSAAYALGNSIALAVKNALGIASPSRVLRAMMGDVGDGMVLGLGDQQVKVGSAAATLAAQVGISPANTYSSTTSAVSGNDNSQKFRDLIVQTPTEDPKAVALEVLNEVTGRL